ncbi:hypothetical protein BOC44_21385 (plasmid) [Burkholderia pseudomallei]|nr:hypothetical protein BOC44_21385 [Burkholderia pseudomallei]
MRMALMSGRLAFAGHILRRPLCIAICASIASRRFRRCDRDLASTTTSLQRLDFRLQLRHLLLQGGNVRRRIGVVGLHAALGLGRRFWPKRLTSLRRGARVDSLRINLLRLWCRLSRLRPCGIGLLRCGLLRLGRYLSRLRRTSIELRRCHGLSRALLQSLRFHAAHAGLVARLGQSSRR